ncbi:MAG: MBL fold metallo-hydrolase [Clostridia bacterium]|nr:MBL fold metallo-hydrolase [Clostridia bacterium]
MKKLQFSLRIVLAALLLLTCFLVFAACADTENEGGETTATTVKAIGDNGQYSGPIILAEDGEPKISIVYQSATNTAVVDTIDYIKNEVMDMSGAEITSLPDSLHDRADDAFEILIGTTKYASSTEMLGTLDDNSFAISVKGTKIIVVASNTYLYPVAAEYLVSALSIEDGKVYLANDYSFNSEPYDAVSLGTDGDTDYTIVYESDNDVAYNKALELKTAFRDVGISIEMIDATHSTYNKEILIGDTGRPLSNKNEAYYKGTWIGKGYTGNIAIAGNIEYGTDIFIDYVYNLGTSGGDIAMIDTMFGNFAPSGIGDAPLYDFGGTPELFDSFELSKSYYIIVHGASRNDYKDYTNLLGEEGFERYCTSEVNGNLFETWTDGYTILTMSHIAYLDPRTTDKYMQTASLGNISYISIAVDCIENSALPMKQTNIAETDIVQISTVGTQCAYVLRLSDGRFVVFDGGMPKDAVEVYDTLVSQNTRKGKPVIAAWFLTHGHVDHIGALLSFVSSYSNKVEIEAFVHNLPGYNIYNGKNTIELDPKKESTNLLNYSKQYYNKIEAFYPEAKIIVAHAGQRFEFGDIDIDVLFTTENIYRKQMLDTNMSSVVYSITGESGRMIILGDAVDIECPMLNAIYEDTLKCDLVQVHHHGYNGGNAEMYASMNADYAIWTNSREIVVNERLHIQSVNTRNRFDYKSVDYNFIPSDGGEPIILFEGMTKEELAKFDAGLKG